MAKNIKTLRKKILNSIVKGIQRNGDRIFTTSQIECPVRTGYMKNTGVKEDLSNGMRIAYRAKYAAAVHNGSPERPIKGVQTVNVAEYDRKTDTGYITVKPHTRKYVNKRLVPIDPKRGIFRVMNKWPARKSNPFLLRAVKKELPMLVDDIGFYLRRIK